MDDLDTISLDRELQTSSYLWYRPIKLIYIVEAEGQLLDAWIFFSLEEADMHTNTHKFHFVENGLSRGFTQ